MIGTALLYVLVFLFTALFVRYHWSKRKLYALSWSLDGPVSLPFVGDALHFLVKDEELLNAMTKVTNNYKSPIKLWFGPKLTIVLTELSHVERVVSSMKLTTKDRVYDFMRPFEGESLLSGSGKKWKKDRRLIAPLLSQKRIEQYMPIYVEQSNILAKKFQERIGRGTFDIELYLHRCASEIINQAVLGARVDAQDGHIDDVLDAVAESYILVHSRITKAWFHNDFIYHLFRGQRQEELKEKIHGFMRRHLTAARARYANNEAPQCVLDHLVSIQDSIPKFATDLEMIHHLTTLYTASEDTIYLTASFGILMFGMHPRIQERVAEELLEVLGPVPRAVTLEDIPKLEYLTMCHQEIMRLFPIGPFIMREASEDVVVEKWTIPKECSIAISLFNLHRDPKIWEKPNEFYPEHFLPEAVTKRHPYAYIPFSAGPRSCVGKSLANVAILTLLATVLQCCKIEADGNMGDVKLKTDITIRSKNGYKIRVERRVRE